MTAAETKEVVRAAIERGDLKPSVVRKRAIRPWSLNRRDRHAARMREFWRRRHRTKALVAEIKLKSYWIVSPA